MNTKKVFNRFKFVAHLAEEEFNRNLRLYPQHINCSKGCWLCCTQVFRITLIDAAVVSRAVKNMDSKKRKEVQEKSRKYLEKKAEMVKSRAEEMGIEDDSEVPTLGLRLSCPLLDEEGACRIYESRPIVCRKFGMPLYDPKKPDELQCCELNFQGGIKIDADELIKNQMTIYDYWMQFKTEVNEELQPEKRATTIAEAILYDYEEMIEKGWRKPREL